MTMSDHGLCRDLGRGVVESWRIELYFGASLCS
jgi:hypothetical protein